MKNNSTSNKPILSENKQVLETARDLHSQGIKEGTALFIAKIADSNAVTSLMEIRKKASYLVKDNKIDFTELLGNNTTQLSTLKRVTPFENVAQMVYMILSDLNDFFNVSRGMSEIQLRQLAIDVVEELWSYRLEEIIAFCHGFKKGHFIKVYERLDASIFWEAFALYEEQKQSFLHERHLQLKGSAFKEDRTADNTLQKFGTVSGIIGSLKDGFKK